MDSDVLWTALALVLVFEGLFPFLSPGSWRNTFLRLVQPDMKSSGSWILRNVRGAEEVLEGRTRTLAGVVIRDQYTIDIQLTEPLAFFLSLMTTPETGIIPATIHMDEADPECDLDYTPNVHRQVGRIDAALNVSFGFGLSAAGEAGAE